MDDGPQGAGIHKHLEAFELHVFERPTPNIDVSAIQIELDSL